MTKIDLSDDRMIPKIRRDISTKSLDGNAKTDTSMPSRASFSKNKVKANKELNKTSATSGSSSKNSKQGYFTATQGQKQSILAFAINIDRDQR